jgi:alginate O-acetyltransferase complex protein AlgI
MIYSSPEFLLLLCLTLAGYALAGSYRARFLVLLAASFIYYAWAGLFDSIVFALVIAVSWLAVALSERYPSAKSRLIPLGIALLSLHLLFWKYTPWIVGQVQAICPGFLAGRELFFPLPLGISFFTLQSIAYLVDYSSGRAEFVSLPTYALFKSFFAQLLAGPIVRGAQLFPQLARLEKPKPSEFSLGLALFVLGFFKKMAVADRIAFFVDVVFAAPGRFGRVILIKALLGYAVEIWADFSGYTDMGRGAALMLGIRLPENFLSPYFAQTPSEFWKRWHITLSEWIKDYLFTPLALAGRRLSARGLFYAAMLTMLIAGLWHGAGWNFALFGLYHGVLLVLERQFTFPAWPGRLRPLRAAARTGLMFGLVLGGWLLFRVTDLSLLGSYLKGLAFGSVDHEAATMGRGVFPLLALCLGLQAAFYYDLRTERWVFLTPVKEAVARRLALIAPRKPALAAAGLCAGVLLAAVFAGTILLRPPQTRGFIYFQF